MFFSVPFKEFINPAYSYFYYIGVIALSISVTTDVNPMATYSILALFVSYYCIVFLIFY